MAGFVRQSGVGGLPRCTWVFVRFQFPIGIGGFHSNFAVLHLKNRVVSIRNRRGGNGGLYVRFLLFWLSLSVSLSLALYLSLSMRARVGRWELAAVLFAITANPRVAA